jgi:hypothetical protein
MTRYLPQLLLSLLLAGCGSEPVSRSDGPLPKPVVRDFSGHWEMDYGRSDNVDQKLNRMYREWQRLVARQSRGDERAAARAAAIGTDFRRLVDTARLADMITSSQVLDIEQTPEDIEIKREDNFALSCVFRESEPELVIDELGLEICGWDAHQLVFRVKLPDGLDIQHRLSLSEDSQRLHIATRVDSRSSSPFTLNRFYFRFDPLPEDYQCEYTLSRGNVCQTGSAAP